MTFKRCSTCGGFMDRRYFHRDKTRRDGLACRCKKCESERQRLLYRKRRRGLVLCISRAPGDAQKFPTQSPTLAPALSPERVPGGCPSFDE